MTRSNLPTPGRLLPVLLAAGLLLARAARGDVPADSAAATIAAARSLGFENVSIGAVAVPRTAPRQDVLAFEDRRDRHLAEALGRAEAAGLGHWPVLVRRLGMPVALVSPSAGSPWPPIVRYPMDLTPRAGGRPAAAPTSHSVDLIVRPLFDYELGRIFDPVMIRTGIQPELVLNPWAGAQARFTWVFPLRNDFEETALAPDINRSRPGPQTIEQYGWLGPAGLGSATAGLFSTNRWGFSLGIARPLAQGQWLLDGQLDVTGFWAASDSGLTYSTPDRTSGWVGVTWRPMPVDVAFRLKAERFLYGDNGIEIEMERTLGDLDLALFAQRTTETTVSGLRLAIPIPPMRRPTGKAVRILPPERITLEYRDVPDPIGLTVPDVASREAFLRQISRPALANNGYRYRAARGDTAARSKSPLEPISWVGMTGFVTTPWCGVLQDREAEVGYNKLPKEAAWDHRGEHSNEVYYASLGILPRTEIGLRWTVMPGLKTFEESIPDTRLTDSDRMVSARVALLAPRGFRPGLAVGIEDASGTRRFHSTYVVAGIVKRSESLHGRLTLGYAPPVLEADRHVLDGVFGAGEVGFRRYATAAVDHDIERWNASLAVHPGFGLHFRAALFDLKYLGVGVGWSGSL
jgi:hypothetical protein